MGLARVEAIAGPGQSTGSGGALHYHWVQAEAGAAFIGFGSRGAEGRCCRGHFPGNLAPSPQERGLRYFRVETVPWQRGVVLPRWPLRSRNFQSEVMRWCQRPEGESGEKAPGLQESRLLVN